MNIDLNQEDLIKEIEDNHKGDIEFLIKVVEDGCYTYEEMIESVLGIVKKIDSLYYNDLNEKLNKVIKK